MSKVVLINPWSKDEEGVRWSFEYQKAYWRNPYFGLIELASYLNKLGHPTKIIDCERDLLIEANGNPDLLLKFIECRIRSLHPDVIGVTGMTYRYPGTYRILKYLVRLQPVLKFKLILGGRHAYGEPEMCLEDTPELECVFYGLSEVGLKAYLEGKPLKEIPGIAYKSNGQIERNPNKYVNDLDELPWADWSLIDAPFYTHPNIRVHRSQTTPLRSLDTACSRGCIKACKFCTGTDGKPKWHSVDYILDFIAWTQKKYGTNATIFQDASLGNNQRFLIDLCEGLIKRNMHRNLIWTANMGAKQVDVQIVRLMYRAGCRLVFIGFESGSDRILKLMRKGCTAADNIACAKALEEAQMPYWASFIAGYPDETEDDILATVRLVDSINPTTGWANSFSPLPGSPIYEQLKREGRIIINSVDDWANYCRTGWGNTNLGLWADMPSERFQYYLDILQKRFREITRQGLERKLEFSI